MPPFRAVPPALLRATRTRATAERYPRPPSGAMVDCAVYHDGARLPGQFTHIEAIARVRELEQAGQKAYAWIGLHQPTEDQMHSVAEVFDIHPLAVEDAVHAHQRPKLERYDNMLFLVLKTVNYVEHESVLLTREIVETGEIMVFVGPDFVVTVRHGEHSGLAGVRKALEGRRRQLALGPYAVMHAIADHVVDSYLDVTTLMEADIDTIEEETFSTNSKTDIGQIYMLKREVVELRRAVAPLSVELGRINTEHKDLLSKELVRYMRDVLDHQTQAADRIASYDEMLSSLVHAALAKVSVQQNIDMRKISAWVAIAAVPTMIAGVYGMNFEHMPELNEPWAYPAVLLLMLTVCSLLYGVFRRNHWL